MGFSIKIRRPLRDIGGGDNSDNDIEDTDVVETAYLSYNWSDYEFLCKKHLDSTECDAHCIKDHLWYIRTDMDEKTGKEVAERCNRALVMLAERDVYPQEGNSDWNPSWSFGVRETRDGKTEKMQPQARFEVFAWHLLQFYQLGLRYYNCIFTHD